MMNITKAEGEEDSEMEMDIERQEGKREMEKVIHRICMGEVIGGPASERSMRHATRAGNKPSFWTYLKENGCRGGQNKEVEETIQHVISGGCEGTKSRENSRYTEEMKRVLEKC
eukprot:6212928-Pleurochrysis_carterae.AAC.2